jgi:hypothetical protein
MFKRSANSEWDVSTSTTIAPVTHKWLIDSKTLTIDTEVSSLQNHPMIDSKPLPTSSLVSRHAVTRSSWWSSRSCCFPLGKQTSPGWDFNCLLTTPRQENVPVLSDQLSTRTLARFRSWEWACEDSLLAIPKSLAIVRVEHHLWWRLYWCMRATCSGINGDTFHTLPPSVVDQMSSLH